LAHGVRLRLDGLTSCRTNNRSNLARSDVAQGDPNSWSPRRGGTSRTFLLIDMPPGTGDVALTLSEVLPRIEMYVVTTPQAGRAARSRSVRRTRHEKLKLSVARRHREHELVHRRRRESATRSSAPVVARGSRKNSASRSWTDSLDTKLREGGRRGRADRRLRSRERCVAGVQGAGGHDRESKVRPRGLTDKELKLS